MNIKIRTNNCAPFLPLLLELTQCLGALLSSLVKWVCLNFLQDYGKIKERMYVGLLGIVEVVVETEHR